MFREVSMLRCWQKKYYCSGTSSLQELPAELTMRWESKPPMTTAKDILPQCVGLFLFVLQHFIPEKIWVSTKREEKDGLSQLYKNDCETDDLLSTTWLCWPCTG